ncbi:hypothetical protein HQ529_05760 [Candidatus Woesearchaeota archaeon]|nr:hypothetical protein [Candidatus Woesearchaeota archaeon]
MISQEQVMNELDELGLLEIVIKDSFETEEFDGTFKTLTIPMIKIPSLAAFNDQVDTYDSRRKKVISYNNAILKTGQHDKGVKGEYSDAIYSSSKGYPVVKPVIIIQSAEDQEYFLVEPKGEDLHQYLPDWILSDIKGDEKILAIFSALGKFFRVLEDNNAEYCHNAAGYSYGKKFEHMIGFRRKSDYEILIIDNACFDDLESNKFMSDLLNDINRFSSKFPEPISVFKKEFENGYGKNIDEYLKIENQTSKSKAKRFLNLIFGD